MHKVDDPKIIYFGTPVVLISTLNEDHSVSLAFLTSDNKQWSHTQHTRAIRIEELSK